MADNPRRIFNLPAQPDTWVEVETGVTHVITNEEQLSALRLDALCRTHRDGPRRRAPFCAGP